jgi:ethanolamine ammonia-lyase small subunit
LGRAGNGLPTDAHLAFQAAHAAARDAVHAAPDIPALLADLRQARLSASIAHSASPDRHSFLHRSDLGRRLRDTADLPRAPGCLDILLCDGLSATAVQHHAPPLLGRLAGGLERMGSIVIAELFAAFQAALDSGRCRRRIGARHVAGCWRCGSAADRPTTQ